MLRDLLNLLGRREDDPTGLRMLALRGEPFPRPMLGLRLNGLGLPEPSKGFESILRSWGGDAVKHSSRDGEEMLENPSPPAPNLKAGKAFTSFALRDTVLVEKCLVR